MTDNMVRKFAEVLPGLRGIAKLIKAAVEDDLFINIKQLAGVAADIAYVVGDQQDRCSQFIIQFFKGRKEILARFGIERQCRLIDVTSTSGLLTKARARNTRCCWPPERSPINLFLMLMIPSWSSASSTAASSVFVKALGNFLSESKPKPTISAAVVGKRRL